MLRISSSQIRSTGKIRPADDLCRAFTLIEAMIAVTMTLIIMLALAQGFKRLSDDISLGRTRLALSDQLRGISEVLRNDLSNMTVDADPINENGKLGYMFYYDGPLTDYSAATAPINDVVGGSTEERLSASKFGDYDDVLSFTSKSNGDFYRGRVPLAIVKGAAIYQAALASGTSPVNYTAIVPTDWERTVVVASEYAEIVYFMMPIDPNDGTPGAVDRDASVNPAARVAGGIDLLGTSTGPGNAVPDGFALCRRVLLIVPELNITTPPTIPNRTNPPALFHDVTSLNDSTTDVDSLARKQLLALNSLNPFMMQNAYQRSDLSLRRVKTVTGTNYSPVAANTLKDLSDPANRFGNVQYVIPSSNHTTVPVLALTAATPLQQYAIAGTMNMASTFSTAGFFPPEFLRQKIEYVDHDDDPITAPRFRAIGPSRSEFLALNCIAFDVKGFDPAVRKLFNQGADQTDGMSNPTLPQQTRLGATGSDDIVMSPSDPGYFLSIEDIFARPTGATPSWLDQFTAARGDYVDLGWGYKWRRPSFRGNSPSSLNAAQRVIALQIFSTPLSGVSFPGEPFSSMVCVPSIDQRKAGTVLGSPGPAKYNVNIYQPSFDSYLSDLENEGAWQYINTAIATSTIVNNGVDFFYNTPTLPSNMYTPDLAVDGLDNDGNGAIDDYNERDTSPPTYFAMPSIQATVRLEDKTAALIQQISVVQSLKNE
jgi:type II secretory pathway pseudopilin PulG